MWGCENQPSPRPSEVNLTLSDSCACPPHQIPIRATCKQTALVICKQWLVKNLKLLTADKFALYVQPHHQAGLSDDLIRFKEGQQIEIK